MPQAIRISTRLAEKVRGRSDAPASKPAQVAKAPAPVTPPFTGNSWVKGKRGRKAEPAHDSFTPEQRRERCGECFVEGVKVRGLPQLVAARHNMQVTTLRTWLGTATTLEECPGLTSAGRPGAKTVIPPEVEAAIARVVWIAWKQNRVLDKWQVLAIAADAAEKHGVVWRVRTRLHFKIARFRGLSSNAPRAEPVQRPHGGMVQRILPPLAH